MNKSRKEIVSVMVDYIEFSEYVNTDLMKKDIWKLIKKHEKFINKCSSIDDFYDSVDNLDDDIPSRIHTILYPNFAYNDYFTFSDQDSIAGFISDNLSELIKEKINEIINSEK